jgi:hypothetical protein
MPELGPYGSMRGEVRENLPYRDSEHRRQRHQGPGSLHRWTVPGGRLSRHLTFSQTSPRPTPHFATEPDIVGRSGSIPGRLVPRGCGWKHDTAEHKASSEAVRNPCRAMNRMGQRLSRRSGGRGLQHDNMPRGRGDHHRESDSLARGRAGSRGTVLAVGPSRSVVSFSGRHTSFSV